MNNYYQPLLPNHTYHLFSRAVGNERLFRNHDNYLFFLKKLRQHTSFVCKLYCYTLLPNHFHLLAKIENEERIIKHFEEVKKVSFHPFQHNISHFIMERFSNFLNCYAKSFNKVNWRKGSLFMNYMKRSVVNQSDDLTNYIWYIHKNAVHHRLTREVGKWRYDSYQSLIDDSPTDLLRDEVLEWFGDKQSFIQFHRQTIYPKIEIADL